MNAPTNGSVVSTISSDEIGTLVEQAVEGQWAELILVGSAFEAEDITSFYPNNTKRIYRCRDNKESISATALASLTNLTSLDLRYNRIGDERAKALASLTNLTSLNLDSNSIGEEGAQALASMTNLTSLNLDSNDIGKEGATALVSLTNLASLNLQHNRLGEEGAKALASLTNLTWLNLRNNSIGNEGAKALASLTNLSSLKLDGNSVGDEGAQAFASLTNLASLYLQNNSIGEEGAQTLASLTNLTSLYLRSNRVGDEGAKALTSLTNLTTLYLGINRIGIEGAKALASLTNLTSLNLDRNRIGNEGAKALASLANLTSLDLSGNIIGEEGATALAQLSNLTSLDLRGNNIGEEGALALASLTNLTSLDLQYNSIGDEGAKALASLTNLTSLYLYGCSTKMPPVLLGTSGDDNCLKAIRAHFLDLDAGSITDKELKLILLGNGRVGKTSLSKRLFHNTFDLKEPSTHGIRLDIHDPFALSDGETCCLNIWDFGGQDIYHGTHALFLKSRAIFIVVWDEETESTPTYIDENGLRISNYPLNYWCDYIRSVSPHSPVIVVQNKCDEIGHDKSVSADVGQWPHVHFSAQEGRGRAPLEGYIKEACEQLLKDNQYRIGVGRAAIKQKIREYQAGDESRNVKDKQHQLMSREDFFALCENENQHGDRISSAESLLSYLHHTGVFYYEKRLFNNNIILDQRWAIDAIYTIYHRESTLRQLRQKKGQFNLQDLNDLVWERDGYDQQEQRLFLSFMESCGICFSLNRYSRSEQKTVYLAPDLLPDLDSVIDDVDRYRRLGGGESAIGIRLNYRFLHQDILRRLMAFVGGNYKSGVVYWQGGFIFEDASCRTIGEVKFEYRIDDEHPARGRVTVETRGPGQKKLLNRLRERIVEIHKEDDVESTLVSVDDLRHWIDMSKIEDAIKTGAIVSECGNTLDVEPYKFFFHSSDDNNNLFQNERSDLIKSKGNKMPDKKPVYISYAWVDDTTDGQKRQTIVERLQQSLEAADYDVRRDIDQIQYRDSMTEFMKEIGEAPCVVAIVSNKYLHSEFCMHELVTCWSEGNFTQRAAPIVLEGIGLSDLDIRIACIQYWADKLKSATEALDQLPREHLTANSGVQAQFDRLRRIAQNVDEVTGKLAEMNTMTPVHLENDDFALVRSAIDESLGLD